MKIAISLLSGVGYGGLTYSMNLVPALAKIDKINEYHVFVHKNHPLLKKVQQSNFYFHQCDLKNKSALVRLFWEQFRLPRELKRRKIDIVFTTKNLNILFAPCRTVISIRNMEPLCYRQYNNYWKLNVRSWLREKLTMISIKKADKIIAVSQFVKDHLEKKFPDSKNKVELVYNGNPIDPAPIPLPDKEKRGVNSYLLSASKFVAYANQDKLIKGYSRLLKKRKDLPPLWLAGGIHDQLYFGKVKKLIQELELKEKIKILDLVSHDRLIELYCGAEVFLFPSTLEACPHTLIEAMACGVPIATTNVPPMPEICEEAAIYFDPSDPEDIAQKIELLLSDDNLKGNLTKIALERCKFFNWDDSAKAMIKVFEKAEVI